jgi:T5SS/PEP-CTERM-associated repeat protein
MSSSTMIALACGSMSLLRGWLLPVLASIFLSAAAQAAVLEWAEPKDGNFHVADNWALFGRPGAGPPGVGDEARFNEAGDYTVSFINNESSDLLDLSAGDVTLRSSGTDRQYRLTSGVADASVSGGTLTLGVDRDPLSLLVGEAVSVRNGGTLNITSGSVVDAGWLVDGAGDATIVVDGAGSELNTRETTSVNFGLDGIGTLTYQNGAEGDLRGLLQLANFAGAGNRGNLNVLSGAKLTTRDLRVAASGLNATASGNVLVDGADSLLDLTNAGISLVIGNNTVNGPPGVVTIANGGTITSASDTLISTTGELNIGFGSRFNAGGHVHVDGGTFNRPTGATFVLAAGRNMIVENGGEFTSGVSFNLPANSTLEVSSGGKAEFDTALDIGSFSSGGDGTLLVDGAGSSVTVTGFILPTTLGANGNGATVTVSNGAKLHTRDLYLAHSVNDAPGTSANVRVRSGGEMRSADLSLASNGGELTAATLTIEGAGSAYLPTAFTNPQIVVGHASEGVATITVLDGGSFTTGDRGITVNATGTVNVGIADVLTSFAKLNAAGDVLINGGTIHFGTFGEFNLTAAKKVTVQNGGEFSSAVPILVDQGSTFSVTHGTMKLARSLDIGAMGSGGTLLVDGDESSVTAVNGSAWGHGGGAANVTVSNGAKLDFSQGRSGDNELFLGVDAVAGTTANVNISSGGKMTLGGALLMARDGGTSTSASVTVEGDGSSFVQNQTTTPSYILVGHASTGSATINIRNGGVFSTGTGAVTLNATGAINLDGGTLNLNGPVVDNGGTFNFLAGRLNVANYTVGSGDLFGQNVTLTSHQVLGVNGATIIEPFRTLKLDGGTLVTGSLAVNGSLQFDRGTLELTGGQVTGLNYLILPAHGEFRAGGTHSLQVTGLAGSTITATGNLTLGNAALVNGFGSAGSLHAGNHTVTLLDANDIVFDSLALVTLGNSIGAGTLAAPKGLTLDFGGNITGFGTIDTPDDAAMPLVNNGHIQGRTMAEPITLTGYVKGVGTLNNVLLTGTQAPGFSPATLRVGNMAYAESATLLIELAGTTPGSEFDRIVSSGTISLDGTLRVELTEGFAPQAGDRFDILDWSALVGTFAMLDLPMRAGFRWDTSQLYTDGILKVLAAALVGDYNADGRVDVADYVVWRDSVGQRGIGLPADGNGDATIDELDYDLWRARFGATAASASAATSHAAVPEPPAAIMLLVAWTGATVYRRRIFCEKSSCPA